MVHNLILLFLLLDKVFDLINKIIQILLQNLEATLLNWPKLYLHKDLRYFKQILRILFETLVLLGSYYLLFLFKKNKIFISLIGWKKIFFNKY
jgi:hypothetical protein